MQPVVDDDLLAMLLQQLPPGFRFHPTDRELIGFFLTRKIAASSSSVAAAPSSLIKDFDVYSTEPWNLPSDLLLIQSEEKEMYFFSPRHPTSTSSKRVNRTAGCGFWHGSAGDTAIMVGSEVIGYRTQLTFKTRGKEKKKINGDWIMHEFHLHSSSDDTVFDDMVLCRIYMKKVKKSSQTNEQEDAISVPAGEQEAVAEGHRVMKRKRADHHEMGTYGVVYNKSSDQNASSLPKLPPLPSFEESNVQSDMCCVNVAVFDEKQKNEEEKEGRMLVKRMRVDENESLVADCSEKRKSVPANTEPSSLLLLEDAHALVSYGDMEDISSLTLDVGSIVVSDSELSEAQRGLEQWLSEEPEQHKCWITVNNERGNYEEENNAESTIPLSPSNEGLQANLHLTNGLCATPPQEDDMYFDISDFRFLLSPTDEGQSSSLLESNKESEGFDLLTSDMTWDRLLQRGEK
ncbi:uncharacterized protein LOC109820531 [Asparagus officinalis]|uniref:uncharacterized protein LOC109820531 n=2 Tax=Asparagus officinalis TaxID=4686 RepID=UPI00098E341B|nr:uncharacterized protein LOC109820531 [Asparagus officinalis]